MIARKTVRSALTVWSRTEALGQQPLAGHPLVEARRLALGCPDTPIGRGLALRHVLRGAIDALQPTGGPPDVTDDRWRPYIILTAQYIEGQAPGYVARQLSLAQSTYHHAQADALDTLAAVLREMEQTISPADLQPQTNDAPTGVTPAGPAPDVHTAPPATSPAPGRPAQREQGQARHLSPLWTGLLAALALLLGVLAWRLPRPEAGEPRRVIGAIPLGSTRPVFIGANPATGRVYVAQENPPGITVIDSATDTVLTTIPTAGYHRGLAINPITNRVYVTQQFEGSVRIIDGATNTVLTDLPVPGLIQTIGDLAINPITNRLYVIRANNNDVAVFDATTHTFLDAVAFDPPSAPRCPVVACDSAGLAVNPATNRVYVAHPASGRITVIDGAHNRVLTSISVSQGPVWIAVNPVTNTLYVTHYDDNSISVIDGSKHEVIATIPVEMGPTGIAVNPTTHRVYVANSKSQTLSIIEGAANLVVGTVPLGVLTTFTALIPSAGRIYVTSTQAHNVTVIEDMAGSFVAWRPLPATGGPPAPRGDTANRPMGFDVVNNRVMFFGGMKGGTLLNDTWVLADADGTTGPPQWLELTTANTPPPRRSHAGAYDAINNRLITYGGCLGGCMPMETGVHVLSHANGLGGAPTWQPLYPAGDPPPPRNGHTAVYDATSNRLIVFGGDNCCGQRYNDTWVLSQANGLGGAPAWLPLTPSGGPPPARVSHSAVYDTAHNRMIVFGGATTAGVLNDVWVLSGANGVAGTPTWRQLAPSGALPPARSGHSAVYDQATGQMLVFGGSDGKSLSNDTWWLTYAHGLAGSPVWIQVTPLGAAPPARTQSNAAYRPVTNRLVLFGGDTLAGSLNDTWTLINALLPRR